MVELITDAYPDSTALAAALSAETRENENQVTSVKRLVLLDGANFATGAEVDKLLQPYCATDSAPINLYDDFEGLALAESGPRLAEVRGDDECSRFLAELAFEGRGLSVLSSSSSMGPLLDHLRKLREIQLPDRSTALFRYQDAQVVTGLIPLLNLAQRAFFLGPLTSWWAIDSCGTTHRLTASRGQRHRGSLRLRQEQVARLDEHLFPHVVANQANETDASILAGLRPCAVYRLLSARIALAKSLGLERQSDVSLFCVLSLQLPEGFERKPPFAAALAGAANKVDGFGALLDRVTSAEWDAWDRENT